MIAVPTETLESNLLWRVYHDKVADRVNAGQGIDDYAIKSMQAVFEQHVISRADDPL